MPSQLRPALVALVISTLTVRLRQQAEAARRRERRTAALYALSRELASTRDTDGLLWAAAHHVHGVFESQVSLLLSDATGHRVQRPPIPSGTGLGLTICRGLVEAHGGQMWAENRPGGGTVVHFTLPLTGTPPYVASEEEMTGDHLPASSGH